MASIYQLPSGLWRAQVARQGVRSSRSFKTEDEARQWASRREAGIMKAVRKSSEYSATLISNIPKRVADAINAVPFKLTDVLEARICLPHVSGIYFLIRGEEVVYVGKSVDVFRRIGKHNEERRAFDAVSLMFAPKDRLDELEAMYLAAFMPPWNMSLGLRARSIERRQEQPEESLPQ